MKAILSILFWIKFILLTVFLFTTLFVMKTLFYGPFKVRFDLIVHRFAIFWSQVIIYSTPGWSAKIIGRENLKSLDGPTIFVANHESQADIWIAYLLGVQFRWLSKAEMFDLPFLGRAMVWVGYIPVKRGDKESHKQALVRSSEWIRRGMPIFFFPEGTRSETGIISPFKIGAFKVAADTNAQVIPVTIVGTKTLIPKKSWILGRAQVRVSVLPAAHRLPGEDIQDFANRVRNMVVKEKQRMTGL